VELDVKTTEDSFLLIDIPNLNLTDFFTTPPSQLIPDTSEYSYILLSKPNYIIKLLFNPLTHDSRQIVGIFVFYCRLQHRPLIFNDCLDAAGKKG